MSLSAIPQSALGLEQFKSQTWALTLPENMTYESLFNQDSWKHIGARFKQGDIVIVRTSDHTLYAELYVRACDKLWVQVSELNKTVFGADVPMEHGNYQIKWGGPKTRFGVYRKSDGERIRENFQTKEAAAVWLDDHINKTAA